MQTLHLIVADVFPPADFVQPALAGQRIAGLETLLARGRAMPAELPDDSPSLLLGRLLGMGPETGPAPYLLAAEGGEAQRQAGHGYWLRLDPVHLRFHRDELYLADASAFDLDGAEAQALVESLNSHFAADGLRCLAPHPQRWYVRLDTPPDLLTLALDAVAGRRIDQRLPKGGDAGRWLRLLNEIQMLFHEHPVNQARESAGKPTINSVWPWGGGCWRPLPTPAWSGVYSDLPLAPALARAARGHVAAMPARLADLDGVAGDLLVATDRLSATARYGDPEAWREGLLDLEAHWFRPALAALRRGRLRHLTLTGTGAESRAVSLTPWRAWRAWRPW